MDEHTFIFQHNHRLFQCTICSDLIVFGCLSNRKVLMLLQPLFVRIFELIYGGKSIWAHFWWKISADGGVSSDLETDDARLGECSGWLILPIHIQVKKLVQHVTCEQVHCHARVIVLGLTVVSALFNCDKQFVKYISEIKLCYCNFAPV